MNPTMIEIISDIYALGVAFWLGYAIATDLGAPLKDTWPFDCALALTWPLWLPVTTARILWERYYRRRGKA